MRISALILLVMALLAQASVPLLHAQNWARMQNDSGLGGLAYAFCGTVSPALLAKMKSVAPPSLYQQLAQPQAQQDCKLCLIIGALGAMLGALALVLLLHVQLAGRVTVWRPRAAFIAGLRGFQARAPPRLSLI